MTAVRFNKVSLKDRRYLLFCYAFNGSATHIMQWEAMRNRLFLTESAFCVKQIFAINLNPSWIPNKLVKETEKIHNFDR